MKIASITLCSLLVEKSPQALPLGAACIASYLKAHLKNDSVDGIGSTQGKPKIDVALCDFNLEENPDSDSIANELLARKSQVYLFSVFVWNRKILTQVACKIRESIPNAVIIAGGPEVTANPQSFFSADTSRDIKEKSLAATPFDFVVSGEGELAITELVQNLIDDKILSEGSMRADTTAPDTTITQRIFYGHRAPLEKLTSPYLDGTLNAKKYEGALWELARGCPFKCSYCYESKGEKTVEYFPQERIFKELDYFKKNGINQIWVLDPTYNANKKRAVEMLDYIAKKAREIFFHFECRAEFLDKELVRAFSKIDCCLQIGLQSADESVLKLVNRPFNRKNFVQKIALLNDAGLIFGFDLIYGLPGDTLHGFEQSINFALGLYPNHLELFRLSVLPGTDLFDHASELHLNFNPNPPYNVICTDKFSSSDLEKAGRLSKACNLFYSQGRAVPWFNSLLHLLKIQAVPFFYKFADFLVSCGKTDILDSYCIKHKEIEQLQLQFVRSLLKEKQLEKYTDLVCDIILLNGAYSRLYSDGEKTTLKLHYHPDDLLSEYAQDIRYFFQNVKKSSFSFKVEKG